MEKDDDRDFTLPLTVTYGNLVLDYGSTSVPNLFLQAYRDLEIDDQEAVFIIHLLAQKKEEGLTFRLGDLPMSCSVRARERCLHDLREKGLLFARRVYSRRFPARVRCIELDMRNLLYNLVRWYDWVQNGRPGKFTVTLSPEVADRICADLEAPERTAHHYHYVPERWKKAAEQMGRLRDAVTAKNGGLLQDASEEPIAVTTQNGRLLHAVTAKNGGLLHAVTTNFGGLIGNGKRKEETERTAADFSYVIEGETASGILTVLDHFVGRVAERWPTAVEQGQPLARVVAERYEVARSLLSTPVAPAAVARAPADLVEELWILAQVLRGRGPVELCNAIDRALMREDKSPCRRLAVIWPLVPGAVGLKRDLERNRRGGERLPGGYREARRLFILLNRFDTGPPLLDGFLEVCREVGVPTVLQTLRKALQEGREFVALEFLRRAPEVRREGPGPPQPESAGAGTGSEEAGDALHPGTGPPAQVGETHSQGSGKITEGEVQHHLANALHALGSFQDREQALPLLERLRRTGLDWKALDECVTGAQARALEQPHPTRLAAFYRALQEEIVRLGGRIPV